ncbi:MAG: outer membrane protein transport protein [Candidatus Marinimicrobia bacterium]|nr:outer membrane protein transport protein [Candidatus Neomarinimicrobiota bacterium]
MNIKKRLPLLFIFTLVTNYFIFAGASDMEPVTSAKSLALGGYYYAGYDDITAAYNNPAGILSFAGSGFAINLNGRAGRQLCEQSEYDLHRSFRATDYSGSAGIYWVPTSKLGFALLYNRAIDYSLDWPLAMSFNVKGTERLYGLHVTSRCRVDALSPAIALRLGSLSLGFAGNLYNVYKKFGFPVGNLNWESNSANPIYLMKQEMQGTAIGWSVGFNYPLTSKLEIGGILRSGYTRNLSGDAETDLFFDLDSLAKKTSIESEFQMPFSGGLGILYKVTEQLSFNLDITTQLWENTLSHYEFNYEDTAWTNRMPDAARDSITGYYWQKMPLNFENSLDVSIGLEYDTNKDLKYRCGYRFSKTPNSNQTYSLLFPDVNQHWFSAGIGFTYDNYLIDLSLAYSFGIASNIKETEDPYFYGEYDTRTILPSINVEYKF